MINRSLRSEFEKMRDDLAKLSSHLNRLLKEKETLLKERNVSEKLMAKWINDRIRAPLD